MAKKTTPDFMPSTGIDPVDDALNNLTFTANAKADDDDSVGSLARPTALSNNLHGESFSEGERTQSPICLYLMVERM